MNLKDFVRDIPDFPKPGILFKDITPLLANGDAFRHCINAMVKSISDLTITKIAGIESRGFIFGAAMAESMGVGFVPIRKPGRLPAETYSQSYALEYGQDTLEIHRDACTYTDKVLIVDDLLATGGTAAAAIDLVHKTGADVAAFSCVIELGFLQGRERIKIHTISQLKY